MGTNARRVESLFAAEAELRFRAMQYADDKKRPSGMSMNDARRNLRNAAITFARLADETDVTCGDGVTL